MPQVHARSRRRARRLLRTLRAHGHDQSVLVAMSAAVGLGTGLLATALITVIRVVLGVAFGEAPSPLHVLLVPAAGGLLVGILLTYWVPESSGSGVVQIMRTMATRGGRVRKRVPGGGVIASGLALGTGASGGREGPIVLIGGSFGSLLGGLFALDEEHRRGLIAAGVAAGIGASFNAPIGGMLFAIELILREVRARSLQMVVIASVVGSVTARELIGPDIVFQPDEIYRLQDPRELLLYAVLGLVAVVVGLAFLYGEHHAAHLFQRVPGWRPLRLALGGLGVGAIGLLVPEVLGSGSELPPFARTAEPIQAMLNNAFGSGLEVAGFLLLLGLAKFAATCLSIGSGNAVGTFAPALFVGAALGGAFGNTAAVLLPEVGIQPGAFALVGMAAVFSATGRAPLTAVLIAFELTNDYGLVLPLMLAAGIATLVADRLQPESVYTFPLRQEGISAAEPEEIDILQTVTVGEVMTSDPETVPPDMPLPELRAAFRRTGHHGFPVSDGDRLRGIVTLRDLPPQEATRDDDGGAITDERELTVADVITRRPVTVTPSDPVFRAVRRMGSLGVGRIPVVDELDHGRLVGLLRRSDLVEAYRRAMTRSLGVQQRREASRLRDLGNAHFLEVTVHPRAPAADRAIRDVDWPSGSVLTSVRRDGSVVLPRGDTQLRARDEVVALADDRSAEELRRLLGRPSDNDSRRREP